MKIEIKNLRDRTFNSEPWQFKVDRSSPVGNMYYMHDESERDEVCDKYELHFRKFITYSEKARAYLQTMLDALNEYGHIELYCWCAPKRCHASTIKRWLISQLKNKEFH